jgi:hypothetical protein
VTLRRRMFNRSLVFLLLTAVRGLPAYADDTRCTAFAAPVSAVLYLDGKGNARYPGIRSRPLLGIPDTKMTWESDRFVRLDTVFGESTAACYPKDFLFSSKAHLIQLAVEREPGHWQRLWANLPELIELRYDWPGRWVDQDRRDNLRRVHEAFAAWASSPSGAPVESSPTRTPSASEKP